MKPKFNFKAFFLVWCLCLLPLLSTAQTQNDKKTLEVFVKTFPKTKSIGVIYSDEALDKRVESLKEAAAAMNIELEAVRITWIKIFPQTLDKMKGKADTVWVMDDPIYSTAEVWKYFIFFTIRNKIKTVVPNEEKLKQGGLFYCPENGEPMINEKIRKIVAPL